MKWEAKIIKHKGEKRIAVFFENNTDLISRIKKVEGSRWSQSNGFWHVPNTVENQIRFKITVSLPSAEGIEAIEKFKQYLRSKRYSESTITTYSEALKSFFTFFNSKSINLITNEDIICYNNDYVLKNKLSASYQNQVVNAVKLYFKTIKDTMIEVEKIHRPKRAKVLPNVLSKKK